LRQQNFPISLLSDKNDTHSVHPDTFFAAARLLISISCRMTTMPTTNVA